MSITRGKRLTAKDAKGAKREKNPLLPPPFEEQKWGR
jgi:hypothetical protein